MKTIKEAYEALNGDLKNTYYPDEDDEFLFHDKDDYFNPYIAYSTKSMGNVCNYEYICTVEEFNNYKPVAPVFTQSMADAGTLPSVGMECLFKHQNKMVPGKVVALTEKFIILLGDDGNERIRIISEFIVEPIAPPIELIDGEAYLFTFTKTNFTCKGIYNSASKTLQLAMHQVNVRDCTNIQLLGVKS